MQSKLSSFFPVVKKSSLPALVYNATNGHTSFHKNENEIDHCTFITAKCGIKLFLKENTESAKVKFSVNKNQMKKSPLFKSNLQKSIRRECVDDAIKTMTWLWLNDPEELYRRLPIIFIEDVMLLEPLSTIVWWMMAGKDYITYYRRESDLIYMASFIEMLCTCKDYFRHENVGDESDDINLNDILLDLTDPVEVLCLHLRVMYGGTAGDMKMMTNAFQYYKNNIPKKVLYMKNNYNYNDLVKSSLENFDYIKDYSIDFHPYPDMLWKLQQQIKDEDRVYLDKNVIKLCIWNAESALNFRKHETLEKSDEYSHSYEWMLIYDKLKRIREEIRNNL